LEVLHEKYGEEDMKIAGEAIYGIGFEKGAQRA
jgi:hypothetical protein